MTVRFLEVISLSFCTNAASSRHPWLCQNFPTTANCGQCDTVIGTWTNKACLEEGVFDQAGNSRKITKREHIKCSLIQPISHGHQRSGRLFVVLNSKNE